MKSLSVKIPAMALMGMETEYGTAYFGADVRDSDDVVFWILEKATEAFSHVKGSGRDLFLGTGGRLMIDSGTHLEFSSPEVSSPAALVIAVRAFERTLADLIRELPGAYLARNNQCYIRGSTFGSHENHCLRKPASRYRALTPHLVSRFIYIGSGGIDPTHPGIRFVLSPRATHFKEYSSSSSRAIWNRRDEPLSGPEYHRFHNILGDTLSLNRPLYLRFGTTSLLIALIEAGKLDYHKISALHDSVEALQTIVRDPTLSACIETVNGTEITALEIQFQLLELTQNAIDDRTVQLPEWAQDVVAMWASTLEALRRKPADTSLEWVVKSKIILDQVRRSQLTADQIEEMNWKLENIRNTAIVADTDIIDRRSKRTLRSFPGWSIEQYLKWAEPNLEEENIDRDELERFIDLRQKLCQIDFHFGAIPEGIVSDIHDQLDDDVPGVTNSAINKAMHTPPSGTRAAVRAAYIRRLHQTDGEFRADWHYIRNKRKNRILRLLDPFAHVAKWVVVVDDDVQASRSGHIRVTELSQAYNEGNYRRLQQHLATVFETQRPRRIPPTNFLPYRAWAESRTGNVSKAEEALEQYESAQGDMETPGIYSAIYRFYGLKPSPRIWRWIQQGDQLPRSSWSNSGRTSFLGHKAYALKCNGKLDEAIEILRESVAIELGPPNHQRLTARNRCDLADCLRILNQPDDALQQLEIASDVLTNNGYIGEMADHVILTRAKLINHRHESISLLEKARRIQHRMGNPIGVVRTNLLKAKIIGERSSGRYKDRILSIQSTIPDLQTCPKLRKILYHWDRWANGYVGECRDKFEFI